VSELQSEEDQVKGAARGWVWGLALSIVIGLVDSSCGLAWLGSSSSAGSRLYNGIVGTPFPSSQPTDKLPAIIPVGIIFQRPDDYQITVAYGRTFGTSTSLDYATLEVSKPLTQYSPPLLRKLGTGELQLALLASYVIYNPGVIERVKRLNFRDGYELAWLPKNKISLRASLLGMVPYMEGGAGLGYVSETYRNSGSRFNWSLLGVMGLEKSLSHGVISLGLQWRHMSNGNMWGQGDELHNSNSGTDMLQGLASIVQRF
jgi:hypothetical protein